jgi:hypothetical protein
MTLNAVLIEACSRIARIVSVFTISSAREGDQLAITFGYKLSHNPGIAATGEWFKGEA